MPSSDSGGTSGSNRALYGHPKVGSVESLLEQVKTRPGDVGLQGLLADRLLYALGANAPEGTTPGERASLALEQLRDLLFQVPEGDDLPAKLNALLARMPAKLDIALWKSRPDGRFSFLPLEIPILNAVNTQREAIQLLNATYVIVPQKGARIDSALSSLADCLQELGKRLPDRETLQRAQDEIAMTQRRINGKEQSGDVPIQLPVDGVCERLRTFDPGLLQEIETARKEISTLVPSHFHHSLHMTYNEPAPRREHGGGEMIRLPDGSPGFAFTSESVSTSVSPAHRTYLSYLVRGPRSITYHVMHEDARKQLPEFLGKVFAQRGRPSFSMVVDGSTQQVSMRSALYREDGRLWGVSIRLGQERRVLRKDQLLEGIMAATEKKGKLDITLSALVRPR